MPVQKRSGDTAARGVATSVDSLRVQYLADGSSYVERVIVSARANTATPTAAQQAGFARVIVRVGKVVEGTTVVAASGGQDAYGAEGVIIADACIPMVYNAVPSIVWLSHRMESGDALTVEVTGGIDNAGAAFDADVSVAINRRPSAFSVTG